jgi:hypothetical protein
MGTLRGCHEDPRGTAARAQVVSIPTIMRWPGLPFEAA